MMLYIRPVREKFNWAHISENVKQITSRYANASAQFAAELNQCLLYIET